jgi:regulator of sirC expression with transglutaminase-like and TPR domain
MSSIEALLQLLEDPDPAVHATLINRLSGDGELLAQAWALASGRGQPPAALTELVLRQDAEALVDAFAEAEHLEAGVWLLPRIDLPRRDYRVTGTRALDEIAARVGAAADPWTVARFLCDDCGFSGARQDYDDPLNSLLSSVLERRVGLPISLTALWVLVCRRLDLTCEPIAIPGHVVGRWAGGYIDLFDHGRRIERADLDQRMQAVGEVSATPYLAPASDRALLRRMARNLVHAYVKRNDRLRATIAHGLATA